MNNIINAGNILPFYLKRKYQNRYVGNCGSQGIGIIGLSGYALPFQVILDGIFNAASISINWINENNQIIPATGYSLDIKHTSDNQTIIIYYGGGINPALSSGLYTLILQVGSNTYYSEEIQIVESLDCYQQIAFTNDCSLGNVYYDGAYTQIFYFNGYTDNPLIEREEEAILNGDNELIIKSSSTKQRCRYQVPFIIDSLLYPVSLIRDHNTVIFYPDQSGISYFIKEFNVEFSVQNDGCFSNAEITFLNENLTNNACCDNDIEVTNEKTKIVI